MPDTVAVRARPAPVHRMDEAVEVVACHPTGRLVAAGDLGGDAVVLDLDDHAVVTAVGRQPGGTTALAWSPDGEHLAAGGAEGTLTVRSARGGRTRVLDGPVSALAWSAQGQYLAVAAGWTVTVLTAEGDVVATLGPLAGAVHDVAWVPGPTPLVAATRDGLAWLVPRPVADPAETWEVTGAARVLAVDPARTRLACGDLGGVLRLADLATRQELAVTGFVARIERLAWDPTGTCVAVPDEQDVVVWTVDGVRLVHDEPTVLAAHDDDVADLAYAPDAPSRLASTGADGHLVHWWGAGAVGGSRATDLGAPGRCLRWRPGTPTVVVGCADGSLHVG